jgi:hypothetical protein
MLLAYLMPCVLHSPSHFILLDFITLILFCEAQKLWNLSLCCVHPSRDPSLLYTIDEVIGKVVPVFFLTEHHAIKTYWGSGGIAPHILDLGTRWRWVISFTPRTLYSPGKEPLVSMRLCGLRSRSWRGGEEVNKFPPPTGTRNFPIIQPVAQCYTTELSRLLCRVELLWHMISL